MKAKFKKGDVVRVFDTKVSGTIIGKCRNASTPDWLYVIDTEVDYRCKAYPEGWTGRVVFAEFALNKI